MEIAADLNHLDLSQDRAALPLCGHASYSDDNIRVLRAALKVLLWRFGLRAVRVEQHDAAGNRETRQYC
jgi:hypothetical protein